MTTTIRVSLQTRALLNSLAQAAGVSMQEVLEHALEQYRRQQLLAETNVAYAALHQNQDAINELNAERREWDETLLDGLEDA